MNYLTEGGVFALDQEMRGRRKGVCQLQVRDNNHRFDVYLLPVEDLHH